MYFLVLQNITKINTYRVRHVHLALLLDSEQAFFVSSPLHYLIHLAMVQSQDLIFLVGFVGKSPFQFLNIKGTEKEQQ